MRNISQLLNDQGLNTKWCLFHVFRNINKKIKAYIKANKVSDKEIEKIQREKLELFSLFDSKSFKSARNRMNEILNQIKDYSKIKSIIVDSLMPYFQTYFTYLLDAKYRTNLKYNQKKQIPKKPTLEVLKR